MPIQFRHELSPLISGPMAWLGGYGIQRGQGSAQVAQQAQAMNSEANANFRQAFDAMNQMGQQAMDHVYRTAQQNQAYKQSLELMPIQARNAMNITSMTRNGAPWDGPNGIVAQAEAKGITVPQYLEQQTQQKAVQALRMKGYEMGYGPQEFKEYTRLQASIAATAANPTIPQEIKPRLIQGMMQRMQAIPQTPQPINRPPSNREIGEQGYERKLQGGGTAYHYSPDKPPIVTRPQSGGAGGKRSIAETNPLFAPGGPLEGFDESAQFAPVEIINNPEEVQEFLSMGRPRFEHGWKKGRIIGYLDPDGTMQPLKDGTETADGIDAKTDASIRDVALKNATKEKLGPDGEVIGTYTDWSEFSRGVAEGRDAARRLNAKPNNKGYLPQLPDDQKDLVRGQRYQSVENGMLLIWEWDGSKFRLREGLE